MWYKRGCVGVIATHNITGIIIYYNVHVYYNDCINQSKLSASIIRYATCLIE